MRSADTLRELFWHCTHPGCCQAICSERSVSQITSLSCRHSGQCESGFFLGSRHLHCVELGLVSHSCGPFPGDRKNDLQVTWFCLSHTYLMLCPPALPVYHFQTLNFTWLCDVDELPQAMNFLYPFSCPTSVSIAAGHTLAPSSTFAPTPPSS